MKYSMRPLSLDDKSLLLAWRNSEHVRKFMYTDHVISIDEHERWIRAALDDAKSDYQIFLNAGEPVGLISATRIDRVNGTCYWAFYVGMQGAPKGIGAIMEYLALQHFFETLKLRKVMCEVFAFNASVVRMHEKFGFVREAHFFKHILKLGQYEDVVSLALFSDRWPEIKDQMSRILFRRGEK